MKKVFFIILVLLIVQNFMSNKNKREFTFFYNVELDSTKGKKMELWLPVPQSNEVQIISDFSISTDGLSYEIKNEKKHGNKYVYINELDGTKEKKTISIAFNVERFEHANIVYDNVDPDTYLKGSSMVPIGSIFNSVIANNNLNNNNLRFLYDFVLSGMHYAKPKSQDDQYFKEWLSPNEEYGTKKVSRDKVLKLYQEAKKIKGTYTFGNGNSIYACDIGVGNCTDYHSYFMSLSRTMNVPARFHMGFSIPNENEGIIEGYHCWADYFVGGEGWYPVDISEADKDPDRVNYFFGTVCNNRVEMIVGRDFELDNYEKNLVNLFIYPLLEINDIESDAFEKNFSYKK